MISILKLTLPISLVILMKYPFANFRLKKSVSIGIKLFFVLVYIKNNDFIELITRGALNYLLVLSPWQSLWWVFVDQVSVVARESPGLSALVRSDQPVAFPCAPLEAYKQNQTFRLHIQSIHMPTVYLCMINIDTYINFTDLLGF